MHDMVSTARWLKLPRSSALVPCHMWSTRPQAEPEAEKCRIWGLLQAAQACPQAARPQAEAIDSWTCELLSLLPHNFVRDTGKDSPWRAATD